MINITPLKKSRDFRLIFIAQSISFLGSMVSYVVVPYHVYQLTKSSLVVGFLGAVQLLPILFFGLLGGSMADRIDRRKLLILSEGLMTVASAGLALNAALPNSSLIAIFVLIFILQSASAYHRPAIEAMTQKMIQPEDFPAVAALSTLQYAVAAIVGPAIGGWMLFSLGIKGAYLFDLATFIFALGAAFFVSNTYKMELEKTRGGFWVEIREGLAFAKSNKTLLGSYIIDIVAMTFAFPLALFPEIVEKTNQQALVGWLYAGMAIGALIVTIFAAGRVSAVRSRGRMIIFAAGTWGVGILFFGFSFTPAYLAIFWLAVAGAADCVSGLQRRVLWNEIIPNNMRGRLAGLEMISYMSGPLLGNFRAGAISGITTARFSVVSGGAICIVLVALCAFLLPAFWRYKSTAAPMAASS